MKLSQSICWGKDTLAWPLRTCFHLWHPFSVPPFLSHFLSVFSSLKTKQHLFSLGTACTFSHRSPAIHSTCLQNTNWHPVIWGSKSQGSFIPEVISFWCTVCNNIILRQTSLIPLPFFCLSYFFFLFFLNLLWYCRQLLAWSKFFFNVGG